MPNGKRIARQECTLEQAAAIGGRAHIAGNFGRKATRISYSTSQGEALAGVGGAEFAQMIAMRYSEVLFGRWHSIPAVIKM